MSGPQPLKRLNVGDSGDDVRRLHATLHLLGSPVPDAEAARGAFGEGTVAALRRWGKDWGQVLLGEYLP
jgi:hypothetical protein